MIVAHGGDTCVCLFICVLCITCSMCTGRTEVNSDGAKTGQNMCTEEVAEVNFGGCENEAKYMYEGGEVNSDWCEDGANYSDY